MSGKRDFEMYVFASELTDEEWEELFVRVAEAAHSLDEQVMVSGGAVRP